MVFLLQNIVPWGRFYSEYEKMFDLAEEPNLSILGCGDGPSGFNAEYTARGGEIVSVDPLYLFSAGQIRERIDVVYPVILDQVTQNRDLFCWDELSTPEELCRWRLLAMEVFLKDYSQGRKEGRYITGKLPYLPFRSDQFDLAICSHLLFYYSDQISLTFHTESIREMIRVAPEVRIFPLVDLNGKKSEYTDIIDEALKTAGYTVEIATVSHEFLKGANQMMKITRE